MLTFNVISHASYAFVSLFLIFHYKHNKHLTTFNISTFVCYTLSTLHHSFPANQFYQQLDYIGIYILIIGTDFAILKNTPLLSIVTSTSYIFAFFQVYNNCIYPTGYILTGWLAIFGIPEILKKTSWKRLTFFLAGGILFSIGEMINLTKLEWSHEIFHVFAISGTLCHFNFIRGFSLGKENKNEAFEDFCRKSKTICTEFYEEQQGSRPLPS